MLVPGPAEVGVKLVPKSNVVIPDINATPLFSIDIAGMLTVTLSPEADAVAPVPVKFILAAAAVIWLPSSSLN